MDSMEQRIADDVVALAKSIAEAIAGEIAVATTKSAAVAGATEDEKAEAEARNARWAKRCETLNKVYVTARYHRRRQRFFDILDKVTKAATVLLGASLAGETLKAHLPLVASGIAGLGLLSLVFGYGDRKQVHKELGETALLFAAKIEGIPFDNVTASQAAEWIAERVRIDSKEPPALKSLVLMCEYDQAVAEGHSNPAHIQRPSWPRRVFADFLS
ncbi:hypothetical protein [Variovorax paradoxus]|uniref:hypothetical protein n=1 Tax=Variovorax paradoxus TaxID=34073 RepID=UPI003F5157F4